MMKTRVASSGKMERNHSQISGIRKDEFLQRVVREIPNLDEELATQVARHLSGLIEVIKTSRAIIEQYRNRTSPFDPNAFSVMKLYRTLGVAALRGRLDEILESGHLQALAKAQQIGLPSKLRGKNADSLALREAIVKGVAKRHEDWLAAS